MDILVSVLMENAKCLRLHFHLMLSLQDDVSQRSYSVIQGIRELDASIPIHGSGLGGCGIIVVTDRPT